MNARAITVRQPWAQLLVTRITCAECKGGRGDPNAEGDYYHGQLEPGSIPPCPECNGDGTQPVKWIETRSRRTTYRGRILIHAAAKLPPLGEKFGDLTIATGDDGPGLVSWALTDYECGGSRWINLPLGAVVGSAVLTDCVPITNVWPGPDCAHLAMRGDQRLELVHRSADSDNGSIVDVTDQLPYGDFTPGRWAWILEDAQPCEQRCPMCWGKGFSEVSDLTYSPCALCHAAGVCGPVPMRGQQATPWTVTW